MCAVPPPPPVLVRSLLELKREMEDLNEKEECVVCMDKRSNTVSVLPGVLCHTGNADADSALFSAFYMHYF